MEDILTALKVGLAEHLQKQGSSLEELEQSLANLNTADGVLKVANALDFIGGLGTNMAGGVGSAIGKIPELGLLTALMTGSAAGAGAYGLGKHFEDQDKGLREKETEVERIRALTDRLKSDYGIK